MNELPDPVVFINLRCTDFGYGEYFRERWHEGETFINVEHDVLPTAEMIDELWNCPSIFCCTRYVYDGRTENTIGNLGCAKISDKLIATCPTLFDGRVHWQDCEKKIIEALGQGNQCVHGNVKHFHYERYARPV
jgi:hypothetical protein